MKPRDLFVTRREMLSRCGMGMGMVALAPLLGDTSDRSPLAPKKPPLPAKAKRVLHLFMNGGASHVDTFDPKPSLDQVRRQADSDHAEDGAAHRRGVPFAVHIPEVRPERHRGQRDLFECRRLRRRPLHRALDAHRHSRTTSRR